MNLRPATAALLFAAENETGMIPEARDHSAVADSLFARAVPQELLTYLDRHCDALAPELRDRWAARRNRTSGTWEDVFGPGVCGASSTSRQTPRAASRPPSCRVLDGCAISDESCASSPNDRASALPAPCSDDAPSIANVLLAALSIL